MLAAVALVTVGCGGGPGDDGPVHVHALGVNPNDGKLFIATHSGLFRVEPGERKARRVGDSTQDTMGFTIVGRDRFLGSGHPGKGEDGPPLLGLIRSSDGGRSWSSVSLPGEADFHVLRYAHRRVYGFDSSNARLLVSADGGASWDQRDTPGPLSDLVVDPRDPRRLVGAAAEGLHSSVDEGRSWRFLGKVGGVLAWPSAKSLYVVDGRGTVGLSVDGGRQWSLRGNIGGQPAALVGQRDELYAALPDGTIKQSADAGASWSIRSTPE